MQNVIIILTLKSTVPVCDTADAVGCVQNITGTRNAVIPATYIQHSIDSLYILPDGYNE